MNSIGNPKDGEQASMAESLNCKKLKNHYYICLEQKTIDWNPADPSSEIVAVKPDCIYFGKVLEAVEQRLSMSGLTFYMTWDVKTLPTYGNNVVAIVVGDEWCRIPLYFNKVKAIFKCYGTQRILGCNPILQPSWLNFLTLFQFLRTSAACVQGWLNYHFYRLSHWQFKHLPIYEIPLGYYKQLDLTMKNMSDRTYDIYFAGSLRQNEYSQRSIKRWIGEPKSVSRKQMARSLEEMQKKYPKLQIKLSLISNFVESTHSSSATYSEELMNSKICLVPRGASFETFRFFEALRFGCVVVSEVLPPRWFYNGAPVIQIKQWRDLDKVLSDILSSENLMQKKHQESLNWWKEKCSELTVGEYIVESLNALESHSH